MKNYQLILFSLLFFFAVGSSQENSSSDFFEEQDTLFRYVPDPVLSLGISGGVVFINPENINKNIEFQNSYFNTSEPIIRTPGLFSLWMTYRPVNLPTFLTLRGELLSSSRQFDFDAFATRDTSTVIGTLRTSTKTTYSVYPITISTGIVLRKTRMKAEIGFIYALASITQSTNVEGAGSSSTTYTGDGYGFRFSLQQVTPIYRRTGLTFEIGYRFLLLDQFRNERGIKTSSIEADYSGMFLLLGLSYGF